MAFQKFKSKRETDWGERRKDKKKSLWKQQQRAWKQARREAPR